jgi:undecaprenyl-diphosphatase
MRDRPGPVTPLLGLGGVAVMVALAALVSAGVTDPVDAAVIHAVRSPDLTGLLAPLRGITELGSTVAVTVVAVVTAALAVAIGPWRHGVAGALTIVGASLLNASIKLAIARERPDLLEPLVQEHGFSFPSGHSALGMVAYGILAVVVWRSRLHRPVRVAAVGVLIALVVLIGVSRVWLGVHYPTDVLAGWTAGAIIVLIYRSVTRTVSTEPAGAAIDAPQAAEARPYDSADG